MNKAILSTVFVSCLLLAACGKKQPPPSTEVPVNLLSVKSKSVLYYDKYPATTAALSQVSLLPQVQGAVTGIFFTEGSHVTKGQKLYTIDERLYKDAYDAAVANLQV
jgi:multidrug efflux pump subunit AcrA (membrane-fusion protein)